MSLMSVLIDVIAEDSIDTSRGPVAGNDVSFREQGDAIRSDLLKFCRLFSSPEAVLYVPRGYRRFVRGLADMACFHRSSGIEWSWGPDEDPVDEEAHHCIVGLFAYAALYSTTNGLDLRCTELCVPAIELCSSVNIWTETRRALFVLRKLCVLSGGTRQMVMGVISQSIRLALAHFVLARNSAPQWTNLEPQDIELLIHFIAVSSLSMPRKVVLLDSIPDTCGVSRAVTGLPRARIVECLMQMQRVTPYGNVVLERKHNRTQVSALNAQVTLRANAYACSRSPARALIFL